MAKAGKSFIPGDGELNRYFRETAAIKPLSAAREFELASRWREHGDEKAMHEMTAAYARLANKIAIGYRGYGLPLEDLVGEASVGLMKATEKFDPSRGFRFSTYAQWWIKASVQAYIMQNWSLVKMGTTANQKKLFFSLRRLRAQIGDVNDTHLSDENCAAIAKNLGVSADEVREMEQRLNRDSSLDTPVSEEGDALWVDFLESADPSPEQQVLARDEAEKGLGLLQQAMATVLTSERERDIFTGRRLADKEDVKTLEYFADFYGISRERVRQIEHKAFEKVQKAVLALSRGEEISAPAPGRGGRRPAALQPQ